MTRVLAFRNRQRTRALNVSLLRRLTRHLLESELKAPDYEIGFHFVEPTEMARVNESNGPLIGPPSRPAAFACDHPRCDASG